MPERPSGGPPDEPDVGEEIAESESVESSADGPLPGDVTRLLARWNDGDPQALDHLLPLILADLRQMAARRLRGEADSRTLQPTALVHEVCLKLLGKRTVNWQNREQFFAVIAQMMRRVLVEYARRSHAKKRGPGFARVTLDGLQIPGEGGATRTVDLLALDEALRALIQVSPRQARVVELRYFVGVTIEETAKILSVSVATVKREWMFARLFLFDRLSRKGGGS
ncbi:MAG: sigma-70 family RNA polymerase sigma factor [Acidobacteriota bacterium]